MFWFNYYGLIAVVVILIPNILSAIFDKNAYPDRVKSKALKLCEQLGRYGCMAFMIFNIPYAVRGFFFPHALAVYLGGGGLLLALYLFGWAIFPKGRRKIKMLWLSITPTALFLYCGTVLVSLPLLACAALFGAGHVAIGYINSED